MQRGISYNKNILPLLVQIKITFPDGAAREFSRGISGAEIAKSISISLGKVALAIKVDGELRD